MGQQGAGKNALRPLTDEGAGSNLSGMSRRDQSGGVPPRKADPLAKAEIVDLTPRTPEVVGPEIPELKEKEKERKASGAYWHAASPGAGSTLARAPGGLSGFTLDGIAAAVARRVGAQTVLGRLLLSRAGGGVLLAGIIAAGSVLGVVIGLAFKAPRKLIAAKAGGRAASSASAPASRERSGNSLDMVSQANQGTFNEGQAAAPAEAMDERDAASPAAASLGGVNPVEPPLSADDGGVIANPLAGALEKARLGDENKPRPLLASASPMGGSVGGMGGLSGPKLATPIVPTDGRAGKAAALPGGAAKRGARNLKASPARSDRSMGQLKFARDNSFAGASAARDTGARQYATDAFEQVRTQGGELAGGAGAAAPQVVPPLGSGAPDVTQDQGSIPPAGPTKDVTPYQGDYDKADQLAKQAKKMKTMGMIMLMLGAALMLAGVWMLKEALAAEPLSQTQVIIAVAMIAMGAALMGTGVMMLAMAQNMAKQAKMIGEMMKQQYDQKDQGQVAADRAQANADGKEYTPPDMSKHHERNEELHENIESQKNATYELDGSKGKAGGSE